MLEAEERRPGRRDLAGAVDAVAQAFASGRLGPAERAELRRVNPKALPPASYWHALARLIEPRHSAPEGEPARAAWEQRWATVLAGMAIVEHAPDLAPGQALAETGFHELRLRRLLRATGDRLADELLSAARFLGAKGARLNWREAARLVHYDPQDLPDWADQIRRRIARDYFARTSN